ncbi:MAG: T9SS type A sorting domain-containing protein, partial [Bacteroidota bacterium]
QINRFSIAWQHAFSEGCLLENNIVGTDQVLFHIQLDFASEQPVLPDVCFESSASFIGQTFTACGPVACGNVDCNAFPGTQIVNEMYTCLDALPVELLSFQAKYQKPNTAFLTWETESEYQSSHFDIERSKGNVTDWGKLGQVIAEGTSDRLKAYQFVDPKLTFDTYYYRLKMWDLDGTYEYSEIRSITIAPNGQIEVYPNPADDHFYLNLSTLPPGTIHLSISNQLGNVVWEKTVDEEEEKLIRIDLQNPAFDNGVYGISLVHAQGKNSLKVVIEGKK